MARSRSSGYRDHAAEVAALADSDLPTTKAATGQAGNFEQRCEALAGLGPDAYTVYRGLSAFCHPTTLLVDRYLEANDSEAQVKLLNNPEPFGHEAWVYLDVLAMMWGARAFDVMTVDKPHRNYLRSVARKLEVDTEIARLSEQARAAEQAAERQRRRSNWKGPRARGRPDPEA